MPCHHSRVLSRHGRTVRASAVSGPILATQLLVERDIRPLVLRGGGARTEDDVHGTDKSTQLLIFPSEVSEALEVIDPLPWRYSWVRARLMRLLPMEYFWWDGGAALELYWGLPAAPLPSRALDPLMKAMRQSATDSGDGIMRPEPAALLAFYAVQVCRPGRGHEQDWESFVRLRAQTTNLDPARAFARRAGVSPALSRALAASDAATGPPGGGGPVFDNSVWDMGWRLAMAAQSRARPRRLRRQLAGTPSLGDAPIRCRVAGVEVFAGPDVFVPTPDADIFVEMTTDLVASVEKPVIVELGTGCGAIALAIAHARPEAEVHAAELSRPAVASAERNAKRLGLDRVQFYTGSLVEPLPDALYGRVDVLLANLPFYPPRDYAVIGSVPRDTIQGESEDGLGLIRKTVRQAPRFLQPGGTLLLQMFSWQWENVSKELAALGYRPGTPQISGPFAICPASFSRSVSADSA